MCPLCSVDLLFAAIIFGWQPLGYHFFTCGLGKKFFYVTMKRFDKAYNDRVNVLRENWLRSICLEKYDKQTGDKTSLSQTPSKTREDMFFII